VGPTREAPALTEGSGVRPTAAATRGSLASGGGSAPGPVGGPVGGPISRPISRPGSDPTGDEALDTGPVRRLRAGAGPRKALRQPAIDLSGSVRMRPWRTVDAVDLWLAAQDPLVRRYAGFLVADRSDAGLVVQQAAAMWRARDGVAWGLWDGADLLGSLRFVGSEAYPGTGLVGYWLVPHARGRGLASAALEAGTRVAFSRLGWHRIELRHAVENDRSCRVARRCGYLLEGTLREGMTYPVDSRRSDEHLHARLASDPEAG
jgi:RimJ/RimL family protein N-acetyltransferase